MWPRAAGGCRRLRLSGRSASGILPSRSQRPRGQRGAFRRSSALPRSCGGGAGAFCAASSAWAASSAASASRARSRPASATPIGSLASAARARPARFRGPPPRAHQLKVEFGPADERERHERPLPHQLRVAHRLLGGRLGVESDGELPEGECRGCGRSPPCRGGRQAAGIRAGGRGRGSAPAPCRRAGGPPRRGCWRSARSSGCRRAGGPVRAPARSPPRPRRDCPVSKATAPSRFADRIRPSASARARTAATAAPARGPRAGRLTRSRRWRRGAPSGRADREADPAIGLQRLAEAARGQQSRSTGPGSAAGGVASSTGRQ